MTATIGQACNGKDSYMAIRSIFKNPALDYPRNECPAAIVP